MKKFVQQYVSDAPIERMTSMLSDPAASTLGSLTPDTLVRDLRHLPTAPRLLPRLKRLLSDANSSLYDIVALIRLDPVLAGRVLQMGNSAYYSKGVRCLCVDEAIHRVGYDQVYELVSYAVASQVLVRPLDTYGLEADALWKHSVACALAAEIIADRCREPREESYTVGLLHALGMVAIDDWALRRQPQLRFSSKGFPQEASESERLCLGFTQADVGGALLQFWEFPREIFDPVRYQYAPRACASRPRLACLLHCAKWLRTMVCGPADERPVAPATAVLQMLGLTSAALAGLRGELEHRLREVNSILDVQPPATIDVPLDFPSRRWA